MRHSVLAFCVSTAALAGCGGSSEEEPVKTVEKTIEQATAEIAQIEAETENKKDTTGATIPDAGPVPVAIQEEIKAFNDARNAGDLDAMNTIQAARDARNAQKRPDFDALMPAPSAGWTIDHPNTDGSRWQSSGGEHIYAVYFMKEDGESYSAPWKQPHVEVEITYAPQSLMAGNIIWSLQSGKLPGDAEPMDLNGVAAAKSEYVDDGDDHIRYIVVPNTHTVMTVTGMAVSDADTRAILDQIDFAEVAAVTIR